MDSIPTGFSNEVTGTTDKKLFECPICLCLIRNATELPCQHLHCADCLIFYEKEEMDKLKRFAIQTSIVTSPN